MFVPGYTFPSHRNINSTRILLESGADPETPSQFGSTAILYAAVDDFFEAAQVLIEQHDANANQPDKASLPSRGFCLFCDLLLSHVQRATVDASLHSWLIG